MLRIPKSNYKTMPWKNGLGVTAEIDRSPEGDGPYLWRFSQASIQTDAPFSAFPGYDRWLAVWQGEAIFLNDLKIAPLEPVRFSGDENTFCRLAGKSVRDVGLIFDRAKVDATMSFIEGFVNLPPSCVHYIFDVASGDTMKFDHVAELSVGRSLLVSVWKI
jgi:environmental stress-induced protein Ves